MPVRVLSDPSGLIGLYFYAVGNAKIPSCRKYTIQKQCARDIQTVKNRICGVCEQRLIVL